MTTRIKKTEYHESKLILDIFTSNILYKFQNKFYICDNIFSDYKSIIICSGILGKHLSHNTVKNKIQSYNWPDISKCRPQLGHRFHNFDSFHTRLLKTMNSHIRTRVANLNQNCLNRSYFKKT